MDLDHFVSRQNIERYRKLSDVAADDTRRRMILGLLSKELEQFERLSGTKR